MMFTRLPFRSIAITNTARFSTQPRLATFSLISRRNVRFPNAVRTYATPAKPKKGSIGASAKRGRATTTTAKKTKAGPKTKASKAVAKKPKAKTPVKKKPAVTAAAKAKKAAATKAKKTAAKQKVTAAKKAKALKVKAQKEKARAKANSPGEKLKVLKQQALSPPPAGRSSAWNAFWGAKARNEMKGQPIAASQQALKAAAVEFKALSPSQKESYERAAREESTKKEAEFKAWVHKHTPEEIRQANLARAQLRRLVATNKLRYSDIKDDRRPKAPTTAYIRFSSVHNAGTSGVPATELAKQASKAWKDLAPSQKQGYVDAYLQERVQYEKAYQSVFGVLPGKAPRKTAATATA